MPHQFLTIDDRGRPVEAVGVEVRVDPQDEATPFQTLRPYEYQARNGARVAVFIPKGFRLDFASVPRPLWAIFPRVGRYTRAALVHDRLYHQARGSRALADSVFLAIMEADKVPAWQRWAMYLAVRVFGGVYWERRRNANAQAG